jgi:hypothetical protein
VYRLAFCNRQRDRGEKLKKYGERIDALVPG